MIISFFLSYCLNPRVYFYRNFFIYNIEELTKENLETCKRKIYKGLVHKTYKLESEIKAFIEQNKIGIGALVEIIRSGDVIPYIKSVTTPAENAKMPNVIAS